jgi:hypothetical protein
MWFKFSQTETTPSYSTATAVAHNYLQTSLQLSAGLRKLQSYQTGSTKEFYG